MPRAFESRPGHHFISRVGSCGVWSPTREIAGPHPTRSKQDRSSRSRMCCASGARFSLRAFVVAREAQGRRAVRSEEPRRRCPTCPPCRSAAPGRSRHRSGPSPWRFRYRQGVGGCHRRSRRRLVAGPRPRDLNRRDDSINVISRHTISEHPPWEVLLQRIRYDLLASESP